MQTQFSAEALADPHTRELESILRSCVHCGFCTATCPTYVTLGDERDSPRGRIYLIKDLLETGRKRRAEDVEPIDHCLSCLSCMTTCPSGVDYRRLVDHARVEIETPTGARSPTGAARAAGAAPALAAAVPRSRSASPRSAARSRRSSSACPVSGRGWTRCWRSRPRVAFRRGDRPRRPACSRRARTGNAPPHGAADRLRAERACAADQRRRDPPAQSRRRRGRDLPKGEGCCGSLAHHMGHEKRALAQARADIDAWTREIDGEGLDAIVVTASGCGATIKDYGYMLARRSRLCGEGAARRGARQGRERISARPRSDFRAPRPLVVAYHAACSLQHGQKSSTRRRPAAPRRLRRAHDPRSASLLRLGGDLQYFATRIANALRDRKVANIARVKPDVIAAGNIGCIAQIAPRRKRPSRIPRLNCSTGASGGPAPGLGECTSDDYRGQRSLGALSAPLTERGSQSAHGGRMTFARLRSPTRCRSSRRSRFHQSREWFEANRGRPTRRDRQGAARRSRRGRRAAALAKAKIPDQGRPQGVALPHPPRQCASPEDKEPLQDQRRRRR